MSRPPIGTLSAKDAERFQDSYVPEPNSGCWLWLGSVNSNNYGQFFVNGGLRLSHRVSLLVAGKDLIPGLVVDHKCRNTLCCNPDHLEQVTQQVNSQRGRNAHREKTHCPKGHPYDEANTIMSGGKRQCRACIHARDSKYYPGQGSGSFNANKTHCLRGHPLSGDNLRINAAGKRICRECSALSQSQHRAKRSQQSKETSK